jgi:hypothetical protein
MKVVELDPLVVDLAKKHFGFIEDQRMKVSLSLCVCVLWKSACLRHQDEKGKTKPNWHTEDDNHVTAHPQATIGRANYTITGTLRELQLLESNN